MDRNIYIALNNLRNILFELCVNVQNMVNVNVLGFCVDLNVMREVSFLMLFDQFCLCVYSQEVSQLLFSIDEGGLQNTEAEMDLAIQGQGYFYILPSSGGDTALLWRGDLLFDFD